MNLHYFFNKGYYEKLDPRIFQRDAKDKDNPRQKMVKERNQNMFENLNEKFEDFSINSDQLKAVIPTNTLYGESLLQLELTTTYPGLFSGSGYTHETGSPGEFMLGFSFDFTSGLPVLPGHSVKGTLRSVFPRLNQPQTREPKKIKLVKANYIIQLLGLSKTIKSGPDRLAWVTLLEASIFEGLNPDWDEKDSKTKNIPMSQRDVFLDAWICKPGNGGKILGSDAITPHGTNPLKNPIPLPFLKVLPGVSWKFSFLLYPEVIKGESISAEQKRKMFERILLDIGIGAKTNVGYGQFDKK